MTFFVKEPKKCCVGHTPTQPIVPQCPEISLPINAKDVVYRGEDLKITGIIRNENLENVIVKIDNIISELSKQSDVNIGVLISNIGKGSKIFKEINSNGQIELRTIKGEGLIEVHQDSNELVITSKTELDKIKSGSNIDVDYNGDTVIINGKNQLERIKKGTNIDIKKDGDDIIIENTLKADINPSYVSSDNLLNINYDKNTNVVTISSTTTSHLESFYINDEDFKTPIILKTLVPFIKVTDVILEGMVLGRHDYYIESENKISINNIDFPINKKNIYTITIKGLIYINN